MMEIMARTLLGVGEGSGPQPLTEAFSKAAPGGYK